MKFRVLWFVLALIPWGVMSVQGEGPSLLVVQGAAGEAEYGDAFARQVQLWEGAAVQGGHRLKVIGRAEEAGPTDRERLQSALSEEVAQGDARLWLILVGHGTFDGQQARFNLRGPDVTAEELAGWLSAIRRPLVIVNTASASAPFLNALSATNRMVITATRSGFEQNYTRFGQYLAECLTDPQADLDKDDQVSLLEAFVTAGNQVTEFYRTEGRLMTEHALLDDNGDGRGTPVDWFRGVRAVKRSEQGELPDGARAHQVHLHPSPAEMALPEAVRVRRDALVMEVVQLRERRKTMEEDEYFEALEEVLMRLARLYREVRSDSASAAAHGQGEGEDGAE